MTHHPDRIMLAFRLHLASYALFGDSLSAPQIATVERCALTDVLAALEALRHTGCVETVPDAREPTGIRYKIRTDCFHLKPQRGDDGGHSPQMGAAVDEAGEPARGRFLGVVVPERLVGATAVRDTVLQSIYDGGPVAKRPVDPERAASEEREHMRAAVEVDVITGHRMDHAVHLGDSLTIFNRGLYARVYGNDIVTFGDAGMDSQPTGADVALAIREKRRLPRDASGRGESLQERPIVRPRSKGSRKWSA